MGTLYRNDRAYGASIDLKKISDLENDLNYQTDTQVSTSIENSISPIKSNVESLQSSLSQEIINRENGDSTLDNKITTETNARIQDIENIQKLIPSQSTEDNQLADKDFVNSSISTNTANFINTFNSITERDTYTTQHSSEFTPNDYCFVATPTETNILYIRYKWSYNDVSKVYEWKEEYQLNNSGFTAEQWNTINSGVTSDKINSYDSHLTNTSNPHSVTKSQVGLGSVVNTGDSATPVSGGTTKFTTGGAYTELAKKNDKITITDDSSSTLNDDSRFMTASGSGVYPYTNHTSFLARKLSQLWNYIKSKISSSAKEMSNKILGVVNTATSDISDETQLVFHYVSPNDTDGSIYTRTAPSMSKYIKTKINEVNYVEGTTSYSAWASGKAYKANDIIYYTDNYAYTCKTDHTSSADILPTNTTYWGKTATPVWKGKIDLPITSLKKGLTIAYKVPLYGGSSSTQLLLQNSSDANIGSALTVLNGRGGNITTHYAKNFIVMLTYDGTNWRGSAYYDSNTTYSTITQAEITAGTSTSTRVVTPKLLVDNFLGKTAKASSATTADSATNLKVTNHDTNNTTYYPIWANGKGDGSTARGTYTSTDLNYVPATGDFKSKKFTVDKKVDLEWNSTTNSLDFKFL